MSVSDPRQAALSGESWRKFCRSLEAAGEFIVANSEDEIDRLEGFRYIARLTRVALYSAFEGGTSSFPVLSSIPYMVKIGCDNPDSLYETARVSPRLRYHISGVRGTVKYLGIGTYSGAMGGSNSPMQCQGYIEDNQPEPGRPLSVIVSADPPARPSPGQQWLAMGPETSQVIVRHFYVDRDRERPADLRIECLNPTGAAPPEMTPEHLTRKLEIAALTVHGIARRFMDWVNDYFTARPNTLDFAPTQGVGGWGDPNQSFRHGYWTLRDGEALVVTVPPVEAHFWNFQLNNIWEESLDYRFHKITVNSHNVRYEPDGSAVIVVAPADPGFGNWIDTAGHRHGTFGIRYNQAVEDLPPTCGVVRLDNYAGTGNTPPDTEATTT